MITNETIESFLYCEYKSYLKCNGQTGNKHPYEQILINRKKELKNNFASELSSHKRIEVKALVDFDFQAISEKVYIVSSLIKESGFHINFDFIELNKKLGETIITPIFLIGKEKVNRKDKLVACIFTSVLSSHLELEINSCKLVYGSDLKSTKCKTATYKEETDKLLSKIKKLVDEGTPPTFYYKKYCKTCEFLERCEHELKNKGCLSLLGGIKANDIKRFNNKGIFTIEQLSFTFRPRRKRKRPQNYVRPHSFELQALALRDNKVLIHETPKLPDREKVQIYFDFEGLPEQGFYYLIGVLIKTEKTEQSFSFWADHEEDEIKIFEQFLDKISEYSSAVYFHYGSYEVTALKKIQNRLNASYKETLQKLMTQSFDVFKVVTSYVYFPVYQNSLKNIATFLNFSWQTPNADGLQSIVWRKEWVKSQSPAIKEKLINYNRDDCYALQKITEFIKKWLELKGAQNANIEGVNVERKEDFSLGKKYEKPSILDEIEYLKKYSHFDYQRERVFVRDSSVIKRGIRKQNKNKKRTNAGVNKKSQIVGVSCPKCLSNDLVKGREINKTITDLIFSKLGVRKCVVQFQSAHHKCNNCNISFIPERYTSSRRQGELYGYNFKTWVIYLHFVKRLSFPQIKEISSDLLNIAPSISQLARFKSFFSDFYSETFEEIKSKIINSNVLFADETPVNLKKTSGYIWVFTTSEEVVSIYKPTREGVFLKEFLEGFSGVLVTDFYSAYDSLPCRQQKCLIHIIRDFNDDMVKHPFNEEYKALAKQFTFLLQRVVKTVDRFGLRKYHLKKHRKEVNGFFDNVQKTKYQTEISLKYQKRLLRNKETLFEFINHDNVAWNNTNAEHAIKLLSLHYNKNITSHTAPKFPDYLTTMSVYQTCKFQNINFLKFMLSKEKSIDEYLKKYTHSGNKRRVRET